MRWKSRRALAPMIMAFSLLLYYQCQPNQSLGTGKEIYQSFCVNCHGADGTLSINNALDLSASRLSMEGRKEIIRHGRMTMTGFSSVLTEAQIDSVARYTLELQQ